MRHARCARDGGVEQHVHGPFDHRVLAHVDERAFLEERRVQRRERRSGEWRDLGEVRLDCRAAGAEHEAERADLEAGGQVRDPGQRRHEDAVHEHQFRRGVGAEGPPRRGRPAGTCSSSPGHERGLRDRRDRRETPFLIARRRKALRCEGRHGALALLAKPGRAPLAAVGHARLELGQKPCAGGGGAPPADPAQEPSLRPARPPERPLVSSSQP